MSGAGHDEAERRQDEVERPFHAAPPAALAESAEKISQLGRRFSTAILPVYSS
jgi:hypothetical protein